MAEQPGGALESKRTDGPLGPERIRGGNTYAPAVDILEAGDRFILLADMPGVRPEDVEIQYERGILTLHGRVRPRAGAEPDVLREYGLGDLARSFEVGDAIDTERIGAELRDGVLRLDLPKTETARTRRIAVRVV